MTRGKKFTSRQYEYARKQFKSIIKNKKTNAYKPWTAEQKLAQSTRLKRKRKSKVTREKMKEAWKTKRSKIVGEITRQKLKITSTTYWLQESARDSQSKKRKDFLLHHPDELSKMTNQLNKRIVCVHCNIETNVGNHNRWHGDNCRINKIS